MKKKRAAKIPDFDQVLEGNGKRGIACPDCGCRHMYVYRTINRQFCIVRVRICRNCGTQTRTVEQAAPPK